jgi:putative hydrolase of the HAD superfamily
MKIYNPNNLNKPNAILFDTDNTLYSYDPAHEFALSSIEKKVVDTYSITSSDFQKAFQEARSDIKKRLSGTASSHSRLLYMQRMLEIMGLGSQVLVALDLEQTYWRTFLSKAVLFEDVKNFLDDIRLYGIPTAIVTDLTAQIQFRKIVYFGLDYYFDNIVTSEEAGYDKPNKEAFELAVQKMKPSGDCIWMIGDNPINDIVGAKESIGAITFQKIHKGVTLGKGVSQPDAAFNDFIDLRNLLRKLYEAR